MHDWTLVFIFMLGASLTSFLHLVALRVPNRESLFGKSYCDHCHTPLNLIDVFPIMGYLIRRGRCRHCNHKIPLRYPIFETLGGVIVALAYGTFGWSWDFLIVLIGLSVLYTQTISDIHKMWVIDRVWMIGWVMLLIIRIIEKTWSIYLVSSVLMFLILFLIAWISHKVYKKDALGGGDVKLYLFIGMLLPLNQALLSLFLAALFGVMFGIIVSFRNKVIPFVPFIALGVMVSYLVGSHLITLYLRLLGV